LCLDNDGQNPHTETLTYSLADKLQSLGKTVWIAQPEQIKQDYNDVLCKQGSLAVVKAMEHAMPYTDYLGQKSSGVTLKSTLSVEKNRMKVEIGQSPRASTHPTHTINAGKITTQLNPIEKSPEPELS